MLPAWEVDLLLDAVRVPPESEDVEGAPPASGAPDPFGSVPDHLKDF